MTIRTAVLCGLVVFAGTAAAVNPNAPSRLGYDDRYKADLLLVFAHPDDETVDIAGYLARVIFDEHRRVAVICVTRGDGGDNAVGNQRAAALGVEREMEGRQALAFLGIKNVWFLDAPDTPSQDVLSSLEHWNHGSILGQIVRLIRLTRPGVVLTWLPDYVAGENHGDHQASSVIATEAFDLAGDPTAFPEQISAPRSDLNFTTEGLQPWQPQKIYYYTDAFEALGYDVPNPPQPSPFRKNFLDGKGPTYAATDISPARHLSYARLAAEELSFYLTQSGMVGKRALETNNFKDFEYPTRLILGKSLVAGNVTGDVFEGVTSTAIPYVRADGFENRPDIGLSLDFGGSWKFYHEFWQVHNMEHLSQLLPVPEVAIRNGGRLHIPLLLRNGTTTAQEIRLVSELPEGWIDSTNYSVFPLIAGGTYPVQAVLDIPKTENRGWRQITWNAVVDRKQVGSVTLRVSVVTPNEEGGLQQ